MRWTTRFLRSILALGLVASPGVVSGSGESDSGPTGRLTPSVHLGMARVGAPVASPDGAWAAYTVSRLAPSGDRWQERIWLLDLRTGETQPLTGGEPFTSPRWSPDGQAIDFLREGQAWRLPLAGGKPEPLTAVPGGLSGFAINPDPNAPPDLRMAIHRPVHPDCPPADWGCSERARARWTERAGLVSELFPLRHWSSWRDSLPDHLFIGDPDAGRWVDLTPGWAACPPFALAGGAAYQFSPDGRSICMIRNLDPDVALSTNNDIFLIDLAAAVAAPSAWSAASRLSTGLSGGGGNDDQPVFSPDGHRIAFTSMERSGYESDLRRVVVHDLRSGEERCLTCDLDRSAGGLTWSLDGRFLYFTAYDREASALYRVDSGTGAVQRLLRCGSVGGIEPLPDGRLLIMLGSSRMPPEIFLCDPERLAGDPERWRSDLAVAADGRFGRPATGIDPEAPLQQLSFHNWDRLRDLDLSPAEHFWFTGALGDSVHGFLIRPPERNGTRAGAVPLVLVLHGGPQWAYHDFWLRSYNFQMIAAEGYAVATINFHGSTGFGIAFQDAIRGHWGDRPGEDVVRGLDFILERYGFIDSTRIAAIGRSFGGYLVNWLNGSTDRFRCLVAHSGGFDEVAGWGTTEELWFPEWEFGGTPWQRFETYRSNSPAGRAERMRTPTLVIHGQRDFRVDLSDGLMTYATLRRQGVPARFLTFADQGHHIRDPEAWRLMWREIFGWLDRYLR